MKGLIKAAATILGVVSAGVVVRKLASGERVELAEAAGALLTLASLIK